jgi:methionyl-tRNA formyltransferase
VKLIFLGTPVFALPALRLLARTRHEIAAVITQPDRPQGRGMQLAPSPVKNAAIELGMPVMQPEKTASPSVLKKMEDMKPDCAVVVAYGQILVRDFLVLPPFGCVNLHPSLLPRHRGPTPIQSTIMAGDKKTGVTTILLDEGMDTGDILLQREVEISDDDTAGSLHDRLADAGAALLVDTLDAVENGSIAPRPQVESNATITRKIAREDCIIDWNQPGEKIHNLVRAMDPAPGCQTTMGQKVLKIWKVQTCEARPVKWLM